MAKLKLKKYNRLFTFNLKINGKDARFLLDTGASNSILSQNSLDKLNILAETLTGTDEMGIGVGGGPFELQKTRIADLHFGTMLLHDVDFFVLDMQSIQQELRNEGVGDIDGVIGGDLLFQYNAVIDYGKQILILNRK